MKNTVGTVPNSKQKSQ